MGKSKWIVTQWKEIRGNLKYDLFVRAPGVAIFSAAVSWSFREVEKARGIASQDLLGYIILGVLVFCALVLTWIAARREMSLRSASVISAAPLSGNIPVARSEPSTPQAPPPVDLQGQILEVCISNPEIATQPSRAYVAIRVQIVNHGHVEAAIIGCGLQIKLGEFQLEGQVIAIPVEWRIKRKKEGLFVLAYEAFPLEPRIGAQPTEEIFKRGYPIRGWLAFEAYVWGDVEFPNAQFDLHLKDSLGGEHCIRRTAGVYAKQGALVTSENT